MHFGRITRPEELTTPLYSLGAKLFSVCAGPGEVATSAPLFTLPPSCISASPTGDKPYPLHRGNFLLRYISPSTWGNQQGVRDPHRIRRINPESTLNALNTLKCDTLRAGKQQT